MFAPINDAFMNLPMSELENLISNPDELRELLLNHVVGKSLYSAGLRSHQVLKMASGHHLNLFRRRGEILEWHSRGKEAEQLHSSIADRLKLEGANVINMDISASNGVIQVVETIVEIPSKVKRREGLAIRWPQQEQNA